MEYLRQRNICHHRRWRCFNENRACTFSGTTTLNVNDGGIFNHNINSVTIFGGAEDFSLNSTVNYGLAGNQTVATATYGNLRLAGSGNKSCSAGVNVNNVLAREETAAVTGTAPSYGSNASLLYKGSAAQTTGIEFPNNFTGSGGVIIDNVSGVTLSASKNISSKLTFLNGKITTGANQLVLSADASVIGADENKYVIGTLGKGFDQMLNPSTRSFEVGDVNHYTPVDITVHDQMLALVMTVKTSQADHPNLGTSTFDPDLTLNRYWTLGASGINFSSYDAVFNFVPADLDPYVLASYLYPGLYSGGAWTYPASGSSTETSVSATGITAPGDIQFGAQSFYESNTSGEWSLNTNWRLFNGTWVIPASAPTSASGNITIKSGHTITSSNPLTVDQLVVHPGATLLLNSVMTLNDGLGDDMTINGTIDCTSGIVSGAGSFFLNDGATIFISSPEGITTSGATGSIQTDQRNFSPAANYIYNGSSAQVTGDGLPAVLNNLTINNSSGVSLSAATVFSGTLSLSSGVFSINGLPLVFRNSDTPLSRVAGTISTTESTDITFGTPGNNGGAAFTIPSGIFSAPPVINSLIINRVNQLTLNDQMMSVKDHVLSNGPLNTNNNLTLVSDASGTAYIDGQGTGEITGNVIMQRYLESRYGYKYVSSPFVAATVNEYDDDIDLDQPSSLFYAYDENRPASGWVNYKVKTNTLNVLAGYAFNMGASLNDITIDVSGVVNNGNLSTTLYNHNQSYTKGFNLVGNPYPSAIDWDDPDGWIKTNIDKAIYFFRASTTDQYGGTYSTYANGISNDGVANNIIPSMQGFFIRVSDGAFPVTGILGLNNDARISNRTRQFLKKSSPDPKGSHHILRLSTAYSDNIEHDDPLVIYCNENGTSSYDNQLDALKFFNTDFAATDLYSIGDDVKNMSINAISDPAGNSFMIPLGLRTRKNGEIVFRVKDLTGAFLSNDISLYDAVTGNTSSIINGMEYRVSLNAGTYNSRFYLIFGNFSTVDIQKQYVDNKPFSAYFANNKLHLDVKCIAINHGILHVNNITGQNVRSERIDQNGTYEYDIPVPNGIYIISLTSGGKRYSQKVIVQRR
jgi:hypothetical protein